MNISNVKTHYLIYLRLDSFGKEKMPAVCSV
uniref:Uncharacterized protein n=1 Tax=Rhizophora mucronata TaxID=61149 RepID=A0A2P2NJH6_RHIMU